jgi:hypothetical protein
MKKQNLLLVAALLAWMTPTSASAQSLGLNFAADDPDTATSSLNPTDVAGVVPAANWNNLFGASGNATGLVYNNNGSPVNSGVTVNWSSPNTWRAGGNNAFPAGPNKNLTSGYLDSTDQTDAGRSSVEVLSIDAALRSPAYDVYVYFVSDSNANRGGGYTLNDGNQTILKYGSTMGSPTGLVEDPGADADNSVDGTYLRFRGLTGTSFTLTGDATLTTPNGFRAPINAIQIVGGVPIAPGPGDVNEDGATNIADFNIIKANFFKNTGALRTEGDLTADGRVDLQDYRIWRNIVPASVAEGLGVPEPSSLTLGALGAFAALGAARRRRRG